MNEIFISVKDILRKIMLGWRLIVVSMLIGAVLFNMVGYTKSAKKAEALNQTVKSEKSDDEILMEQLESKVLEAEQSLTEREIEEAKLSAESYFVFQEKLEKSKEYNSKSIKMQLDPSNVPQVNLQYLIDTHYEAVYPVIEETDMTKDIIYAYINSISTEAVCEEIASKLNWDTDLSYVKELISGTTTSDNTFVVTIMAPDEESCKAIAQVVDDAVKAKTSDIQSIYGSYDITQILNEYFVGAELSLLTTQQTQAGNMNTIKTAMNNLINTMSNEQKTYYYALVNWKLTEEQIESDSEADSIGMEIDEEVQQEVAVAAVKLLHIKYILLGMFIGAFLAVCYIGAMYLLSAKLRTKEDLEESYGLSIIGTINVSDQKKRILGCVDQLIEKVFSSRELQFSEEEKFDMICAGIRLRAAKSGMKSVHLTGVVNDKETENLMAAITENLKNSLEVTYGKPVIYDPEALEAMTNADGVVVLERIECSRYDDTKKLLTVCKDQKVPVLGGVVITQIYR